MKRKVDASYSLAKIFLYKDTRVVGIEVIIFIIYLI